LKSRIGIIGAGVVGTAVGVVLNNKGYEITGVHDIRSESTKHLVERTNCTAHTLPQEVSRSADILFITTSDSAVPGIVEVLASNGAFFIDQVVIHMSGALSSKVLSRAKDFGANVLSVHPLQSFADLDGAITNLPGSVFSIEGDQKAFDTAINIVESLEGEYFFIDTYAKPLYHAGACVVSNYLVAIAHLGTRLLEAVGIPHDTALKALMPLIKGTVNNLENIGLPGALTGPISRGDLKTVINHINCMDDLEPELKEIYSWLGSYTTNIAVEKGSIDSCRMEEFQKVFLSQVSSANLND